MRLRRLLGLASLISLPLWLVATGEKVREYYPDGTLKVEYVVDSQGRKHGLYREFHPDGRPKARVVYKLDAMDGPYESWHANGAPERKCRYKAGVPNGPWSEHRADGTPALACAYKDGKLEGVWTEHDEAGRVRESCGYRMGLRHGIRRLFQGGEPLSEQEWQDGLLVGLFGSRLLYATTLDDVRRTLAGLMNDSALAELEKVASSSGNPAHRLTAQRARALARLQGHRFLAGVSWRELAADPAAEERATLAADLAAAVGAANYAPDNPGWDEERFQRARDALQRCNLARGWTLPQAVDAWVHPNDPALFPKLAARRLCLEPRMAKIGLGLNGEFAAMWTGDSSGAPWRDAVSVSPAHGWMPVEWFDSEAPWSARLNLAEFAAPDPDRVRVKVQALDEDYLRHGEPFPIEHFHCERELLIFRPQLTVLPGFLYWVEVTGLTRPDGTPAPLGWLVHFVSERSEEDAAPPPETQ